MISRGSDSSIVESSVFVYSHQHAHSLAVDPPTVFSRGPTRTFSGDGARGAGRRNSGEEIPSEQHLRTFAFSQTQPLREKVRDEVRSSVHVLEAALVSSGEVLVR